MKIKFSQILLVLMAAVLTGAAPKTHVAHPSLAKLKWQLAGRSSTFPEMTTFNMLEMLHEMNFHHVELSPGQVMSADHPEVKISQDMSDSDIKALMAKFKAVKLDVVSFGVADFGTNEANARKVFEFGKKLKLSTLISDPSPESLPLLDKLAGEYQINIALTSATTNRRYITCDAMLDAIKGRSERIGVCADLAAWKVAGQDPSECATKLGSHVLMAHISNIDSQQKPAPLISGTINVAEVFTRLKAGGFKGICCVQDESEPVSARPDEFAKSIGTFSDIVTTLAATP